MADKKISELTTITGANTASGDLFVIVDVDANETKKITRDELTNALELTDFDNIDINGGTIDGVTIGGASAGAGTFTQVNFGDNAKAVFGAGSDLQIYHDGSNSVIQDSGTGDLEVQANRFVVQSASGADDFLIVTPSAGVDLRHNVSGTVGTKLATTATGIDVTGTVTADGLVVDGDAEISSNIPILRLMEADTTDLNSYLRVATGKFEIHSLNDAKSSGTRRFQIDNATGDISFYEDTGTTPKLFWDASAEALGIGTTSPDAKIQSIGGTSDSESSVAGMFTAANQYGSRIRLNNTTANTKYDIIAGRHGALNTGFQIREAVSGTDLLYIDSSGNVGIGTTSPSVKLDVVIDDATTNAVTRPLNLSHTTSGTAANGIGSGIAFNQESTTGALRASAYIDSLFTDATDASLASALTFTTRSGGSLTERMRIDSSGNVNINATSTPAAWGAQGKLYIKQSGTGVGQGVLISCSADDSTLYLGHSGSLAQIGVSYGSTGAYDPLSFATGGSERMRIDSSGNVGIGTSSPSSELEISAATSPTLTFERSGSADGNGIIQSVGNTGTVNAKITLGGGLSDEMRFDTDGSERMRIDSSGSLLVGYTASLSSVIGVRSTTSANPCIAMFNTAGAGSYQIKFYNNNTTSLIGSITNSGNTSTAYNTSSDYRLKNITGPITNSGEYIDSLNPVEGTWKADGSTFVGLIAHEVQEVSRTQVATGEKDGEEMQGMDYSSAEIIANLIAEVKALRQRVYALENQ